MRQAASRTAVFSPAFSGTSILGFFGKLAASLAAADVGHQRHLDGASDAFTARAFGARLRQPARTLSLARADRVVVRPE